MRIVRAADCRILPWKNGGGATAQIAIYPEGASLDDFDWRISMAHVGSDGPFSTFFGIDRTLSVLTGNGIRLVFGDRETTTLDRTSEPFAFSGERAVRGLLVDGAIDDLNVMTRRSRWDHGVVRWTGPEPAELSATSDLLIFVSSAGHWTMGHDRLNVADSIVLACGERVSLAGDRHAEGLIVSLRARTTP